MADKILASPAKREQLDEISVLVPKQKSSLKSSMKKYQAIMRAARERWVSYPEGGLEQIAAGTESQVIRADETPIERAATMLMKNRSAKSGSEKWMAS